MLCECSGPVARQKCTYGNMAESELLCVRVATLQNQICKHTKSDVIRQYMSELSRFFHCSRYLPGLNYCPGKNHTALAITLVRTS